MPGIFTPATIVALHLSVLITVSVIWSRIVPQPYMDEIFHIPQAQRYCQGDYWTWDPKLTTPPGLYVISNILLAAQRPLCSTFFLRLTNLSYPFIILFTVASLLKSIHPHLTRQERLNSAAVIICFPILWFFNFLYYTDGGSSAFILLSWLAAKKRHHLLSALGSAVAVTFRQTNIIWSLFIVGTALLELSTPAERRRFDPKAAFVQSPLQLIQALTGFIQILLSKFTRVITISLPYLGLLAGFAAFVKWNGGIVLGDRSNHIPSMHVMQLFYFAVFSAGMSMFAILGVVPVARLIRRPTFKYGLLSFGSSLMSRYNGIILYALVPAYIAAAWFCWQALGTEQTILWVVIYAVATMLTLIPSPLLEFRYFITPYLIYRIAMRQPRGVWLFLELLFYTAINAVTVWMFLNKPFRWAHQEGVQRFMW
ncbi:glucosyltransferase [Linnemannia hyalina]|uniref:Dol-P-Glc:Glc(2)Man(9)GlcNAc(2)-PP-Dol alpha-1,2-glucosyltransferase n=1 Tax=Linnemannia hyalina TaxID=64524 RepID=A0A9P7XIW5_9FUNG|nr:glucosyltransferase [Linnemannia hyalina]